MSPGSNDRCFYLVIFRVALHATLSPTSAVNAHLPLRCTAFDDDRIVASGPTPDVAVTVRGLVDTDDPRSVLVFDDATGFQFDLDLRGSSEEVRARAEALLPLAEEEGAEARDPAPRRGPGRPKLGVVSREVTLLPRHWAWLSAQRGGASAALRRLVEHARRDHTGAERVRKSQDAAYRFMSAMLGDHPGFVEATRALFAGDPERFDTESASWPTDPRTYARGLATYALETPAMPADGQ